MPTCKHMTLGRHAQDAIAAECPSHTTDRHQPGRATCTSCPAHDSLELLCLQRAAGALADGEHEVAAALARHVVCVGLAGQVAELECRPPPDGPGGVECVYTQQGGEAWVREGLL